MENSQPLDRLIAQKLLRMKAFYVQVANPFTWANGWKSPIYLDDRKVLSYVYTRNLIKLEIARLIAEHFPDADVVAGIATNAIAPSILAAEQLGLPYIYVYPKPKNHGLENQIEGDLRPRQKVVIIDNQVHVGNDAMAVIDVLHNNACTVEGVVTLFELQLPSAYKKFEKAGVPFISLTNFKAVMDVAKEEKIFTDEEIKILTAWHEAPTKWYK